MLLGVLRASQKVLLERFLRSGTPSEHPFFILEDPNFERNFGQYDILFFENSDLWVENFQKKFLVKNRIEILDPVEKILEHDFSYFLKNRDF